MTSTSATFCLMLRTELIKGCLLIFGEKLTHLLAMLTPQCLQLITRDVATFSQCLHLLTVGRAK